MGISPTRKGREMLSELPFSLYWEDETKLVSFVPDRSFKPGSPKIFCPGTKCRLDRVNLIFSLWRSLIALADTHYIFHTLTHTHITFTFTQTRHRHTQTNIFLLLYTYTHTHVSRARDGTVTGYRAGRNGQSRIEPVLVYWERKNYHDYMPLRYKYIHENKDHNRAVVFIWWNLYRGSFVTW